MDFIKNKKILLVGLGRLGGGLSLARFLSENGAKLTVTDLNSAKELKNTLTKLKGLDIKFVLGEHRREDFKNNDLIVFNPAVGIFSNWFNIAKKYAHSVENDFTLFLQLIGDKDYIAVTGTRGKTTSSTWIHHFLKPAILGGNIPNAGLFRIINKIMSSKKATPLVLELSSFQLEFIKKGLTPPKVAVITNLYGDHLNRYGTKAVYAEMKAKVFLNQTKEDFLILNFDDKNKSFFLAKKPKSRIFYISLRKLSSKENGLYFDGDRIYFRLDGIAEFVASNIGLSRHQRYNLLTSLLASYLYSLAIKNSASWGSLTKKISSLPSVPFRQEMILSKNGLTIINDSAATSPDATVAALESFKNSKNLFLIAGGTDKNLDFKDLAKSIKGTIPFKNLFLLDGTATKKIVAELRKVNYSKAEPLIFNDLDEIIPFLKKSIKQGTILFSPSTASFEKFKNEFDRGKKFNSLIKEYYGI